MPIQMTLSDGEVNEMAVISPVTYEVDGNQVTMTYTGGMFKGNSIQYSVQGDVVQTAFGSLQRVSR